MGPDAKLRPLASRRGEGPPNWLCLEYKAGPTGTYSLSVRGADRDSVRSVSFEVAEGAGLRPTTRPAPLFPDGWSGPSERLFAAWLEALFLEADERSSWRSLYEVLRDPARNLLHGHLGLGEDDDESPLAPVLTPDCADNPYFLRAYFAWKVGLPFGFHETTRGSLGSSPRALRWHPVVFAAGQADSASLASFRRLLAQVKNIVHAGNGRTSLRDDATDLYPLPLRRERLRPGTVYADPYGHTLVIVRWERQTRDRPGLLLAVDAQPDGTIGVKRFWKGNFLFTTDGVVGQPGFKAFRPIVLESGRPRLLSNAEIAARSGYGDFSLEQERMEPAHFYASVERLINPRPLDPVSALEDLLRALHEQLLVRVDSVANGEAYLRAHPGAVIPMPTSGPAVFLSLGPWEDYSTPNRDLRLLIALDTVLELPDKVAADPASFGLRSQAQAEEARHELARLLERRAGEMAITYERSDGSPWTLTLAEILRRREAFEMGYNPNDSPEVRWGAPEESEERSTARRRAPAAQIERMKALRPWFKRRLRPPS